ncbi:hypothetical protein IPA_06395 [Ignicoccus pacificus DSM 13166]|uniref:CRISPR-associated endonuclease Cas1 n=1 Tax=Ignicoccus pacificus DSM 13166 TaxID=940294 RepID=A0A977PL10_9CREN|nr:hypothetical protein IPA_06395 [Ignicoccus pacificus DSM 13166]
MILIVRGHAYLGRKGYMLTVRTKKDKKEVTESFPIIDLDMIVIVGKGVVMSTAVLELVNEQGVPLLIHGKDWDAVLIDPIKIGWAEARRKQYLMRDNETGVHIAKEFIYGKLEGMSRVAKNLAYKSKGEARWSDEWRSEGRGELASCKNIDCIRKVEAVWSAKLWKDISSFIPNFEGRVPRARDPGNRALDYIYALIYGLCTHALIGAGLDPYAGLIHKDRAGKVSFTFDFSEMFKPAGIYVMASVMRTSKLRLEDDFLDKESLEKISQAFYALFEDKKHAVRRWIYGKAWELRNSLEKGTAFKAYVFYP